MNDGSNYISCFSSQTAAFNGTVVRIFFIAKLVTVTFSLKKMGLVVFCVFLDKRLSLA